MTCRTSIRRPLGLLLVAFVLLFLFVGAVDATTRIVPLGDSLTKGMLDTDDGGMHPTYRYWLWNKLRSNGYDVDFVGSWNVPNFPVSFDKDNEGHGGYTIGGILNGVGTGGKLSTWLSGYSPDMALVLIGTNDVLAQTPMATRFSNLNGVVNTLRAKNPRITIVLAKLPPTGDSYRNVNSGLIEFNNQLPSWASSRSTSTSRIIVVDLYSGFDGKSDNQGPRYIHPDESGEKKIADRFYAAITPYLSKGTPVTTKPTATQNPFAISGPRVITTPGNYYLTGDLVNRDDVVCIEVMTPGVTIDGRGYRLGGNGQNSGSAGIFINGIPDVTVKNMKISGWTYGVYYIDPGVGLGRIEGCTIENNLFAGIVLYRGVTGVSIIGNRIQGHATRGIWISDAHGNVAYNNRFMNQGENVEVVGSSTGNSFSVSRRTGPNIIGGPYIGGNYWAKPSGNGFSETHGDGDGDGFCDEAFAFAGQVDALPIASPYAPTPTKTATPTPTLTPGPFATLVVPGLIEAEDYDNGGEGVAYHDTVAGNQGGAYRTDDVDIESVPGGFGLAYIRDTEWTRYTVTVQETGDYLVGLRAAAWNGPRTVRLLRGTTEIGTIMVPVTGSTTSFETYTTTVRLEAGTQELRLAFSGDSMNLDRIEATLVPPTATVTPTATPTPTPNGSVVLVPGGVGVPTETGSEGLYDDVNGNQRKDFADVVLFFNQLDWIAANEPVEAFDFNRNGRIDFADVVTLFNTL
ncbi:MAG: NosD domain-containing protein [Methanoregulaceae archaeon]